MSDSTPAILALRRAGVWFEVRRYRLASESGTGYREQAVAALGLDADQVFKTLIAHSERGLVCAVLPVSVQLDLKALGTVAGSKRMVMADRAATERSTGSVLGGISPLGQRTPLPTVIDETAHLWPTIHVSAGRRGLEVELDPADLQRLTDASFGDIGR